MNSASFKKEKWYRAIRKQYQEIWANRQFSLLVFSFFIFLSSIIVSFLAGVYATDRASNMVTDIVLSNTPAFNVDAPFVYGTFILAFFIAFLCLIYPKRFPFILSSMALFYLIRSFFVLLTHLGPYPIRVESNFGVTISRLFFGGGDFFFSGHTGAPFLMALLFWRYKPLRYIFLFSAIFFAVIVLLGHLHYTIDVASAFFITYTIYRLSVFLFPKQEKLFSSADKTE